MIWCYPCSPCSYFSRTYCDLWYCWVCYNWMDNTEWRSNMQEGTYQRKKKKSVTDQFPGVKYRSEAYCWTKKVNRDSSWNRFTNLQGRLRGRQVLGNSFFFSRLRFEISRMRLRFWAGWDLPMTTSLAGRGFGCGQTATLVTRTQLQFQSVSWIFFHHTSLGICADRCSCAFLCTHVHVHF